MLGREKKTRIFVHIISFGQKLVLPQNTQNHKKTINFWFQQKLPKTKTFFVGKGVFGMGEKVVFTNCVFEKLCSRENTIFRVFSAKHNSCSKICMLITQIIYESRGLFLNMAKRCF